MHRIANVFLIFCSIAGCNGDIYLRDGVTNGNSFHIAPFAIMDDDPVTRSWIRYSLSRSVCQLALETENPARASSFDCELTARRQLAEAWNEKTTLQPELTDAYLDDLSRVQAAGFLDEYVVDHFSERVWSLPENLDMEGYGRWHRREFHRHRPETRIVGSWSYRAFTAD